MHIIFRLDGDLYALNTDIIKILRIPEAVTKLPNAPASVLGVASVNGTTTGVVDLRLLLGKSSVRKELDAVAHVRQAHLDWVTRFSQGQPVETNPHRCALGQWLDSYTPTTAALQHIVDRLTEPHAHLHSLGHDQDGVAEAKQLCDQTLLPLLDAFLDSFESEMRGVWVVTEQNSKECAFRVDSVEGCLELTQRKDLPLDSKPLSGVFDTKFGMVLEIRQDWLMQTSHEIGGTFEDEYNEHSA